MKHATTIALLMALPAGAAIAAIAGEDEGDFAPAAESKADTAVEMKVDSGKIDAGALDQDGGLTGAGTNASVVRGWDTNNNGVVDETEWMGQFDPKTHDMKDLNGDGLISANEFATQLFAIADENGDGKLSDKEINVGFLEGHNPGS